jgi:uroporphyrinogen decarboxylase
MNCKERVRAAIEHREPDVCPWCIGFTIPAAEKLAVHYGDPHFESKIGNHVVDIGPTPPDAWVEVQPDHWRDEFGVVWNREVDRDIGNVEFMPLAGGGLRGYKFPDPHDPRRYAHFFEQIKKNADRFVRGAVGFSLFERAWTLRGMEALLIDMVTEPAFVEALLGRITDHNLALIDEMCEYPIDAVHFGDDWGQQRGLIMGPACWRRFIKPCLKKMYSRVKSKGKFVTIHSCGDIREVLPDLIDLGLDCFNPFQPEVMDVEKVKREFGKHLAFFGGISTQKTLPYGKPADVRREVRRRIEVIGKDGGYICAPAHSIPKDVPVENMVALIEELHAQVPLVS